MASFAFRWTIWGMVGRHARRSACLLLTILGLVASAYPSLAGGGAKPKESKPQWMAEVNRLQSIVAERARWAGQVDPEKAYEVLLSSGSFRKQYGRFEAELQGEDVAWIMARKDVIQNLTSNRFFMEHSSGKHHRVANVETYLRCYIDDDTAAILKSAEPESKVLCVGKIVEFDFFRDFLAIGVRAQHVMIGGEKIETWLSQQPKAAAQSIKHKAKH